LQIADIQAVGKYLRKFLTKCQKMGESGGKWGFLYYFYTVTRKCRYDNVYRGIHMQG
jgi:hypothetical protein